MPIAGEAEHRATGIATAPVLLADGEVVGDSSALEWLEQAIAASPPLLPAGGVAACAGARMGCAFASEVLAPYARLTAIGKFKQLDMQPLADHFAAPTTEINVRRCIAPHGSISGLVGLLFGDCRSGCRTDRSTPVDTLRSKHHQRVANGQRTSRRRDCSFVVSCPPLFARVFRVTSARLSASCR